MGLLEMVLCVFSADLGLVSGGVRVGVRREFCWFSVFRVGLGLVLRLVFVLTQPKILWGDQTPPTKNPKMPKAGDAGVLLVMPRMRKAEATKATKSKSKNQKNTESQKPNSPDSKKSKAKSQEAKKLGNQTR